QPSPADLAHHPDRDPAHDDHPAGAEHRHLPLGRLREGAAAVQPPDLSDRRRHRDVSVPNRHRVQQLQLRHRDRPVRVDHRPGAGAGSERDLQASSRDEPVVTTTASARPTAKPSQPVGIKDSLSYRTFRAINTVLLIVVMLVTLYPFVNVIAQSFSAEGYIISGQVNVIPRGFNIETYKVVMADSMFWTNYKNTVVYTVVGTAIAMALTTTFAYALSKKRLKGRTIFIGIAVFTMFFNGGLIPNYILIKSLGMTNSIWAIVLPNAISIFNLLVMKAFFENLPEELEEAASVDGLTTYGIFGRIVLPLSKAVL